MSLKNVAAALVTRLRNDARGTRILAEWLGDGGQPVTFERAEKRARTCAAGDGGKRCPHNKVMTRRLENSVAQEILKHEEIRHTVELRTSQDSNLNNCEACGCYLKLKVWVPIKHIPDEGDKFPAFCWQVTERNERLEIPIPQLSPARPPTNVPVAPAIRIRREDAFGDVIQASILATKLWELGYDVWWRCSDATRPALLHHPHITGFIMGKDEPVDVNLDKTYEGNLERNRKDLGTLFLEAADHQLKRGGFMIPSRYNRVPILALTEAELNEMRHKLKGFDGRIVSYVPRSNAWPSRTIAPESVAVSSTLIDASVIWAYPGDPPEGSRMHKIEIRSFRHLMALIALSDVVVTPDTGPLHIAAAFNRPIVVVEQAIAANLRLTLQTDWTSVNAPVSCIRCGEFTCPISPARPPCQKVPPELIAATVNTKLAAIDGRSVSVIIPVYKLDPRLLRCLSDIRPQPQVTEIIIAMDGGQKFDSPGCTVVDGPGTRTGYGKTCMRGAHASKGAFLLFLNDDCYLKPGALAAMMETMERGPRVGVVGAQLWYPDGTLQHGGTQRRCGDVGFGHIDWHARKPSLIGEHSMEFVTFAAALVRRSVFYAVRGFDEEYDCYCEDSDFCLKVKQAGYEIIYNANAVGIHDESQTTSPMKAELSASGERVFRRRWARYFEHNPAA